MLSVPLFTAEALLRNHGKFMLSFFLWWCWWGIFFFVNSYILQLKRFSYVFFLLLCKAWKKIVTFRQTRSCYSIIQRKKKVIYSLQSTLDSRAALMLRTYIIQSHNSTRLVLFSWHALLCSIFLYIQKDSSAYIYCFIFSLFKFIVTRPS